MNTDHRQHPRNQVDQLLGRVILVCPGLPQFIQAGPSNDKGRIAAVGATKGGVVSCNDGHRCWHTRHTRHP